MNLSKSSYTKYCQCPKLLWLSLNKKEKEVVDPSLQRRFNEGSKAGDLAMDYFGSREIAEERKPDGSLNISVMLSKTKKFLEEGVENICEASFQHDGYFCAVDILHKQDDGYAIVEVKSSTAIKDVYIWDISFQKWVLEQCGINVTGTYIMHINNQYVFNGKVELDKLFKLVPVDNDVRRYSPVVPVLAKLAKETLTSKDEPTRDLGSYCKEPYECAFWKYCKEEVHGITGPSVFDLYRMNFTDKLELYKDGIVTFEDILNSDIGRTEKQDVQVLGGDVFDDGYVSAFLNKLKAPLYFLDFETFLNCVPQFVGTKPYKQIPFQYSLHYFEGESDVTLKTLKHKEFLADGVGDPRRAVAERLIEDIPDNATIIAYNMKFERGVIKDLADTFPELSDALLFRREHFYDLWEVFVKGYVYKKAMGGSFSIKSVLPALFPDDPEKDYHFLEEVHNGTEATDTYLELKNKSPQESEASRKNLLEYCKKDTMAMVWIWQWLVQELERRTNK